MANEVIEKEKVRNKWKVSGDPHGDNSARRTCDWAGGGGRIAAFLRRGWLGETGFTSFSCRLVPASERNIFLQLDSAASSTSDVFDALTPYLAWVNLVD
jgi:hypothetical protein